MPTGASQHTAHRSTVLPPWPAPRPHLQVCQPRVCPLPTTPSTCHQNASSGETLGCITGECGQRAGREDFYPPRGSGLEPELLQQAICLKLSIPRIFRDQRNGLLLSEPYANEPPDRLFVRLEKRHSVILTMESPCRWALVYFIFQITFCISQSFYEILFTISKTIQPILNYGYGTLSVLPLYLLFSVCILMYGFIKT